MAVSGKQNEVGATQPQARVFRIEATPHQGRPPPSPAAAISPASLINFDITQIRGAMEKRRRVRAWWLAARLTAFVILPTAAAGYWFSNHATPIYASHAAFVLQQQDRGPATTMPGMGALGGNQDAISLQGYIESREAFEALDARYDIRKHLTDPGLDSWHRTPEDASGEALYEAWRDLLRVSFDPTEGVMRMEVRSFSPDMSKALSEYLLKLAEERIDKMTLRLREDAVASLMNAVEEQTRSLGEARARLLEVQNRTQALSGAMESELVQKQLATLEAELTEARLSYASVTANTSPYPARVTAAVNKIRSLEGEIAKLRGRISGALGDSSIAAAAAEIAAAEQDIETRTEVLQGTIANLETARAEAIRQSRYLAVSVRPLAADEAIFPKPFANTLVTFLTLLATYLLLSLSASLVRDQIRR